MRLACVLAVGLLGVCGVAGAEPPRAEVIWLPAQVADASHRAYEPIAIQLIDQATSSIALAMYYLREGEHERHPINRLLNDLLEAAGRGVRVELYLNTKFPAGPPAALQTPWLARLESGGVAVTRLAPTGRWHGKLLIVDERYVLEGSANWSVEALKTNGESNTLMDSPPLARWKLTRLRAWAAPPEHPAEPVERVWPETIAFPSAWLAPKGLLSQMVTRDDERGCDALLAMARYAAAEGADEFFISLEALSDELSLPTDLANARRRLEIRRVLDRLRQRYALVEFQISYGEDAWVRLHQPEGPRVTLPMALLAPERLAGQELAVTYLALLAEQLRQEEGVVLETLTLEQLAARTGLSKKVLSQARRELEHNVPGTFTTKPPASRRPVPRAAACSLPHSAASRTA